MRVYIVIDDEDEVMGVYGDQPSAEAAAAQVSGTRIEGWPVK